MIFRICNGRFPIRVMAVNPHCPMAVRDRESKDLSVKFHFTLHKFEEFDNTSHHQSHAMSILQAAAIRMDHRDQYTLPSRVIVARHPSPVARIAAHHRRPRHRDQLQDHHAAAHRHRMSTSPRPVNTVYGQHSAGIRFLSPWAVTSPTTVLTKCRPMRMPESRGSYHP